MNVIKRLREYIRNRVRLFYNSSAIRSIGNRFQFFTLFAYVHHRHTRKILLPKDFDLEAHVRKYPPLSYGYKSKLNFNIGKLYYFLSLLSSIPARNKDLINDDRWVPISMSILRNNIKDIKWYKDYLISTGIIEYDNVYIPGKKAFWYSWSSRYSSRDFEFQEVICPYEDKAYFSIEDDAELKSYPYLLHWYKTGRLEINSKIDGYSKAIYDAKMDGTIHWSINPTTHKKKDPKIQYETSLVNINKICHHIYEVHIDKTVHRLHSVITNMQSDYRNFLTYGGSELVNIDIKNSQPYIACLLLNPKFWEKNSSLPVSLYSLPKNMQISLGHNEVQIELNDFFKKCQSADFKSYIDTVTSGKFYEEFAKLAETKLGKKITRKEAKVFMFYTLFSGNKGQHEDPTINALKKLFSKEIYPSVAELFMIIKRKHQSIKEEKQHNRLACLLQSIESEIILHRCCKRIWEEHNHQIPIFTIHDSIATTVSNEAIVKKIMIEELSKCIGVAPTIDTSNWNIKNIDYPILFNKK